MQPTVGSIWRDDWNDGRYVRVVQSADVNGWLRVTWCNKDGSPTPNTRRYTRRIELFEPVVGRFSHVSTKDLSK